MLQYVQLSVGGSVNDQDIETHNLHIAGSLRAQVSLAAVHAVSSKVVSNDKRAFRHEKLAAYTVFNKGDQIPSVVLTTYVQNTFTPVLIACIDRVTYMPCDGALCDSICRILAWNGGNAAFFPHFAPLAIEIMRYTLIFLDCFTPCLPFVTYDKLVIAFQDRMGDKNGYSPIQRL